MTTKTDQESNQFYARLTDIISRIHQAPDFDAALPNVEPAILEMLGAERVTVYQRDRSSGDIISRFQSGNDIKEIRVPISTASLAGFVAFAQHPVRIKNVRDPEELATIHPQLKFDARFESTTRFRSRAMLIVPIMHGKVLLGVLQLINSANPEGFSTQDEQRAAQLADLIGQKFRYDFGCTDSPWEGLIRERLIDQASLGKLAEKSSERVPLSRLLLAMPELNREALGRSLEQFYQVPFIAYEPERYQLHPVCEKINQAYLKNNNLVLLAGARDDRVVILIDDPSDTSRVMVVENFLGNRDTQLCCGLIDDIHQYLGLEIETGAESGNLSTILGELEEETVEENVISDSDEVSEQDSTVVRLVNRILLDGRRLRASDIHIEPGGGRNPASVRMRIDGVCQEIIQIPATHVRATVSRIKIISRLDIAERRLPQDGKFSIRLKGLVQDVRVATIPTVHGEGVVLRLLQSGEPIPFDKLNLSPGNKRGIEQLLRHPHGILLVVGPTGSGKTTTLHAVLACLNTPDRKIWTAEDPVEITQPGLQQVQIQPRIGFDFATALRAFLRADPDVILIGEMRDRETAHAGVEASLTGHMVFSTLHTNSAPETITRLLDLGIDPVSFADALLGVLAQRLVRTLCSHCKAPYTPSEEQVAYLKRQYGDDYWPELNIETDFKLYKPVGCAECNDSGYRGRTGIHELLVSDAVLRELIYRQANVAEIKAAADSAGMRSLLQDGIRKVVAGQIDLEQLHRVTV
ncbi:MAG: GspE/PulE family protein [Oceanospirillales bacterium]|nr:GspE/PulE family protein [Oceanospirillales bacterium]